MTTKEKIVDQHIREYESRLKHLDELFERAKQSSARLDDDHALKPELGSGNWADGRHHRKDI